MTLPNKARYLNWLCMEFRALLRAALCSPVWLAGRIARAWRQFLWSPSRLRAVASAVAIQAAWRGLASRRRTELMLQQHRQHRMLLAGLLAAVSACDLTHARQAAEHLAAAGGGTDAQRLLAGLERRAAEAAHALHAAAAADTADAYHAAAAQAARYSHLAAAVQEAEAVFAARVAAAEQAVAQALAGEGHTWGQTACNSHGQVRSPTLPWLPRAGGTATQFSEAAAAAASLGISRTHLQHAEQQVEARNQLAAAALQAALDAQPFSADQFAACLQRARQIGLHVAAVRAERGLQLRRHQAALALQQAAAEGSADEVESACREACQLGLAAEAESAASRLEQRQAAAAEELRQAALSGTLQQYAHAAGKARALAVGITLQRTCYEQLQQRQQEAEQQLRLAADCGELPAVRRRCQAALALGLCAAVDAAEQRVNARRVEAAEQLAASTRAACNFATAHAEGGQRGGMAATQLAAWLSDAQRLVGAIEERGAAAALAHPPSACTSWPGELRGWLVDAHRAACLELQRAAGTAAAAVARHLEALASAAAVVPVPLQPLATPHSTASGGGEQQAGAGQAQGLEACLQQWREMQQDVLPLVAALAAEAAEEEDGAGAAGEAVASGASLDLSGPLGLRSFELLAAAGGIAGLDLSHPLTRCAWRVRS